MKSQKIIHAKSSQSPNRKILYSQIIVTMRYTSEKDACKMLKGNPPPLYFILNRRVFVFSESTHGMGLVFWVPWSPLSHQASCTCRLLATVGTASLAPTKGTCSCCKPEDFVQRKPPCKEKKNARLNCQCKFTTDGLLFRQLGLNRRRPVHKEIMERTSHGGGGGGGGRMVQDQSTISLYASPVLL